jgi:hypothetical protein
LYGGPIRNGQREGASVLSHPAKKTDAPFHFTDAVNNVREKRMLEIVIEFALPTAYRNPFVTIYEREHTLKFTLQEGTNTATSDLVDLGIIHGFEGRRLLGQFTFQYSYNSEQRVVTVSGTDFDSAGSMCLMTVPEGTSENCYQHAAGGGFDDDELTANPHWNYQTPLTPGLPEVFAKIVRTVNKRLIEALEKQPTLIVQVRKPPPELSAEEHQQFLTVYKNGEFQGFYESGREYGAGYEVLTIESVFGGEVTFSYQENLANVIGSTPDPKIAGLTWIQLWANQFGTYPVICMSYQFGGFGCGNSLVGGHVITGTQAKAVAKGSNSVYIMPICIQHNNDDNVYMQALKYLKGIWLKNYLGT